MNLYLHNELKKYFSPSISLFDQLMQLNGECYRRLEGRITQRIKIGDHYYFIKQHRGVGWKEIFKNMFQGRWPILSATNEKLAIEKLQAHGIAVPCIFGYGQRGFNPAWLSSFILLQDLSPTVSLEEVCRDWLTTPPKTDFKRQLIQEVARIARILHENGVNHRDFYICHFLLDKASSTLKLYLIDLHRAQIRKTIPVRWIIKDLAGLFFSSLEAGLTRRDYYRFICHYRNKNLREIMHTETGFWQRVEKRGKRLFHDHVS